MTSNQIAAKEARETARSNRAKEREAFRSNRAKEKLTEKDIEAKRYAANVQAASNLVSTAGKMANDPSWYNKDPQMVKDVASLSYETPLGYGSKPGIFKTVLSTVQDINPEETPVLKTNVGVPGVAGIAYIPMLGNESIVRTAALNIYSYVRHANSGSRNYEFQDLMKYLYAVDSIYIGIAELKRIYSILNTYKGYNRFYSDGYITALGYDDPKSFYNVNLAALRYSINEMVQSVNALYIPNVMSMYVRHDWMSTGIFKDHKIKRSTNYMFYAKYIYQYNEDVDSKEFGCLIPKPISADGTLQGIISRVQECLDILKRSEDIGIMSGDILKAYGNNNMFLVNTMSEDYHIEETYSEEVLSQINAADTFRDIYLPSFYIYEDDNGNLKQGFDSSKVTNPGEFHITGNTTPLALMDSALQVNSNNTNIEFPTKDLVINMYKDDVTPDDNMVASRLMVATDCRCYPSSISGKYIPCYRILSTGTDMCINVRYIIFNQTQQKIESMYIYDGRIIASPSTSYGDECAAVASCLDWAPRFRQYLRTDLQQSETNTKPYTLTLLYDNKDLCNYASINTLVLDRMHRVAVNSELGVPLLGMQVRR